MRERIPRRGANFCDSGGFLSIQTRAILRCGDDRIAAQSRSGVDPLAMVFDR